MKIALIVENPPGNVHSGGRVHAVGVACGLQAIGHKVTFITQHPPTWWASMSRYYEMPEIKLTNRLDRWRGASFQLVISYPILATLWGLNFARELGIPHWAVVLDAWPIISKWAPAVAKRMHYSDMHTKALRDSNLLLTISEYAVPFVKEWTGNQNVQCLMGCVNSRCADSISVQTDKTNRFVAITRATEHKRLSDILYCSRALGINVDLLTSFHPDKMRAQIAQAGLSHLIHVHASPSEEEKFRLIRGAIAGIGASAYEGLGMPFMEYLYCGKPVVCYDFPILREVCGDGALYANHSSPESLANQVAKLMDDYTRLDLEIAAREAGRRFSFESMCERLGELFND